VVLHCFVLSYADLATDKVPFPCGVPNARSQGIMPDDKRMHVCTYT
jgi:hypothetical protein